MTKIDDNTRIVIRSPVSSGGYHKLHTTLGEVMRDNDPDAMDRDAIVAALAADEVYTLGGGAAPAMLIYRDAPRRRKA